MPGKKIAPIFTQGVGPREKVAIEARRLGIDVKTSWNKSTIEQKIRDHTKGEREELFRSTKGEQGSGKGTIVEGEIRPAPASTPSERPSDPGGRKLPPKRKLDPALVDKKPLPDPPPSGEVEEANKKSLAKRRAAVQKALSEEKVTYEKKAVSRPALNTALQAAETALPGLEAIVQMEKGSRGVYGGKILRQQGHTGSRQFNRHVERSQQEYDKFTKFAIQHS